MNARKRQIEISVPGLAGVRSSLHCSVRRTVTDPEVTVSVPFLVSNPMLPTEAVGLLAETWVTSDGIFCPPRGAPGSPCNPSHSRCFDTFLYKGNTSRGKEFLSNKKVGRRGEVKYTLSVI